MCSFDVHLWLKIMNSDRIMLKSDEKQTQQEQGMLYSKTSIQYSGGRGSVRKLKTDKVVKRAQL